MSFSYFCRAYRSARPKLWAFAPGVLGAVTILFVAVSDIVLAGPQPSQNPSLLNSPGAAAIVRIIRSRVAGESAGEIPEVLRRPLNFPLLVALYGLPAPIERSSARATLAESAEDIGEQLARFLPLLPNGERALRDARLQLDVVVRRKKIAESATVAFAALAGLEPGLNGLAISIGDSTTWYSPLALFRRWRSYMAQDFSNPSGKLIVEVLTVESFVEERPGGKMLSLYRGNVLMPTPHAEEMVQAMFHAGLWLLRTQQSDGAFLPAYSPGEEEVQKDYNLTDHLRATVALAMLRQLTGDARFGEACDRALQRIWTGKHALEEAREGILYLPAGNDEIVPSALLLTALCYRALMEPNPTVDARMNALGEFLCKMIAANGKLYARLSYARKQSPPYVVRGSPYAETLVALSMLERISPKESRRRALDRMANLIVSFPPEMQLEAERRALARLVEGLAEYCKLTRSEKHAEAAFKVAELLAQSQNASEKAAFADYVGGFGEAGLPPDSFTTAAAAAGLAAAYELCLLLRRPAERFAGPVRAAGWFLLNMQFRPENSFFLKETDLVLGAFRRSPGDLTVQTATSGEAIRALLGAATVAAETVRPAEGPARP